jgi:hypothetical protein
MEIKPAMDRGLLHPASNKAIAMNADGTWLSFSHVPVANATHWQKTNIDTVCFRIPPSRSPNWTGPWQESLLVFEEPGFGA